MNSGEMIHIVPIGKVRPAAQSLVRRLFAIAALLLIGGVPASLQALPVSGIVTDRTTGKPAAADTVALLGTGQGLPELVHTTTGAAGSFSFDIADRGTHLIRVDHDGVGYYTEVSANSGTLHIDVYDAASAVAGLKVEFDVIRIEADRHALRMVESYFVRNDSRPPRTQLSAQGFEIFLPPGSEAGDAAATDSAGVTEMLSPVRRGRNGRYSLVYPLRPGGTQLEVQYSIPYAGSFAFDSRVTLPTDNLAIMLPESMTLRGPAFTAVDGDPSYQTFLRRSVTPGRSVSFMVAGTGSIPAKEQDAAQDSGAASDSMRDQSAEAGDQPGGGLGAPIETPDPLQKYKWVILAGLSLMLVAAAALVARRRPGPMPSGRSAVYWGEPSAPRLSLDLASIPDGKNRQQAVKQTIRQAEPKSALLAALREEMLILEGDRVAGNLSESEYAEARTALETALRRALSVQSTVEKT